MRDETHEANDEANDGVADSNTASVDVTVNAVNDIPQASNDKASQSVQFSDPIAAVTITASDEETAAANLTASANYKKDAADCSESGFSPLTARRIRLALAAIRSYPVSVRLSAGLPPL